MRKDLIKLNIYLNSSIYLPRFFLNNIYLNSPTTTTVKITYHIFLAEFRTCGLKTTHTIWYNIRCSFYVKLYFFRETVFPEPFNEYAILVYIYDATNK